MMVGKNILILYQLALDLMGINQNAFSLYHPGMSEQSCFSDARQNNERSICRTLCIKRKYAAYWTGNMDTAAKMYELHLNYPIGSSGRLISVINSTFVDGLIALYFARKHGKDEAKWTELGESVMKTMKQWVASSGWNFMNKLKLLEAEYAFLKEDDKNAMADYNASIKAARDHKFLHEEGLAQEKAATYLLHKSRHDQSLGYFINAKKCYESWGAYALVERVDKAIAILMPLCTAASIS